MRPEPRVVGYTALGTLGLLVGLIVAEPAAVAFGAAFLLPVVYGLAAPRPSLPDSDLVLSRGRVLEGDAVELRLQLVADAAVDWLEVELPVPARARLLEGRPRLALRLRAGETRTFEYRIQYPRWGVYPVGGLRLRGAHRLGALVASVERDPPRLVRVYPRIERLRRLVRPLATRPASGSRPAAVSGDGIEFAELRDFRVGDRARRVNWRASARRGQLLVSDQHPERSSDIVLFLDSLTEAATEDESTLDLAVRATATLVGEYLRDRDRVGLLSFGGDLEWVLPAAGERQSYRIVDAVLSSESARLLRWRDLSLIPTRVLPPQSLVVALTPLLDWRVNRALLNLRARGYDLTVVELDPLRFAAGARALYGEQTWRVWLLERELTRHRFERAGVPVSRWDGTAPLAAAVEELTSTR